tara:strand:- start:6425 stop:6922 length:498 start_codon:yes stop_codon:yes gene_type:complete
MVRKITNLWFLPLLIGGILRWYQINDQIVLNDELYSINYLIRNDYWEILTHFGKADHCIPLTILYKLLAENIILSEIEIPLPVFIIGMISIALFPLMVKAYIGKYPAYIFSFLLAISPICIHFSRFGRPYIIALGFSFIGIISFYKRWRENKIRHGKIYLCCVLI